MIYNHQGKAVWDYNYTDAQDSRCPICDQPLVGKRFTNQTIWHWAHLPKRRNDCPHFESRWHLIAKFAQSRLPGWVIEHPITVGEKKYRVDAFNKPHRRIREFVHTVTPYYYQKHLVLRHEYSQINWVYDGEEFVSLKAKNVAKGGMKKFLKPRAWELFTKIGGLVHHEGQLWNHWKENIWYPYEDKDADRFLDSYEAVEQEIAQGAFSQVQEARPAN